MRRGYLILALALVIAAFFVGRQSAPKLEEVELAELRKQNEQLEARFQEMIVSRDSLSQAIPGLKVRILEVTEDLDNSKQRLTQTKKYYENKIDDVADYNISALDSFFTERYPGFSSDPSQMEGSTDRAGPDPPGFTGFNDNTVDKGYKLTGGTWASAGFGDYLSERYNRNF